MRTTQQNPLIWLLLLFSILACLIAPQRGTLISANIGGDLNIVSQQDSTQKAVDDGNNSLTTGSLTQSDLQNKDTYHASGFALSATVATKITDQSGASKDADQRAASDKINPAQPGASAGIGSQSGSQSSTTLSRFHNLVPFQQPQLLFFVSGETS